MSQVALDVVVYGLSAFLGNVGVALTGFGMAIIFLFVWQVATLAGFESDMKTAIFMQAVGLLIAQPQLLWHANVPKFGSRQLLWVFIPVTIFSTPLGAIANHHVPTKTLKGIGGGIVTLVAIFEIYRARRMIWKTIQCKSADNAKTLSKNEEFTLDVEEEDEDHHELYKPGTSRVFFMIGSQRSGSNWLNTMVGEREDIAAPHPPHIFDNFMPQLSKYGNLHELDHLEILIDHVCTFTERNTVEWRDIFENPLRFDRSEMVRAVLERMEALEMTKGIEDMPFFLMAVFDTIYTVYARSNKKYTFICKSMGMSKYHDLLTVFYGPSRLHYIYLIRDPRDVAMSFMKTPVGDCHYYEITKKWVKNQEHALKIVQACPDNIFEVRYESMLKEKEAILQQLYDFMGKQLLKQDTCASVQDVREIDERLEDAKGGRHSSQAAGLSVQFMNLTRGKSFADKQFAKWLNGDDPLTSEELILIESLAWQMMDSFGYETHIINETQPPKEFTAEEICEFTRLNAEGIKKMNADLWIENEGDAWRREHKAEVLKWPAEKQLNDSSNTQIDRQLIGNHTPEKWPIGAKMIGQLTEEHLKSQLQISEERVIESTDGYQLRIAAVTQAGYYPQSLQRKNQDTFCLYPDHTGTGKHLFAVYDGHGPKGDMISNFVCDEVPKNFTSRLSEQGATVKQSLVESHEYANRKLMVNLDIDDTKSGTTAITLYMEGRKCFISNVGDSQCFLASAGQNGLEVQDLSEDHTPLREDERDRVKKTGARIMTLTQLDGTEPMHEDWETGGQPPRVWSPGKMSPGTAFTRSIGDTFAKNWGVVATPEIREHWLQETDRLFVVASDGITQHLSHQDISNIAFDYQDASAAALALVSKAYHKWIGFAPRVDDMTVILVYVEPPGFDRGSANKNMLEPAPSPPIDDTRNPSLGLKVWAGFAGWLSGFLGGLCGIRGPPIIVFFLHLTCPKSVQKATGAAITVTNVFIRIVFYVIDTFRGEGVKFDAEQWPQYCTVCISSVLGIWAGQKLFERVKENSKAFLKTILAFLLLISGVSLLLSAFVEKTSKSD